MNFKQPIPPDSPDPASARHTQTSAKTINGEKVAEAEYLRGLDASQVAERMREGRHNRDEHSHSKTGMEILLENTFNVFNIINFVIIGGLVLLYVLFQNRELALDSLGLVSVVVFNTLIAIVQEFRARALLNKARLMLTRTARVVRDAVECTINQSDIVEGDVVRVERGDQIVVDGKILHAEGLEIDESLLSGESLSIAKTAGEQLLSGSFVLAGRAWFRAEKVGKDSYAAGVTKLARRYKFDVTPLQRNINRIFEASFLIALIIVAIEIFLRGSENLNDIEFIRRVATVVTALVPEGLVLLSTVIFAVGVGRVNKLGALVQKLNAIESFSGIDCVCMDKTGTLTQNRMVLDRVVELTNRERALLTTSLFAHHSSDNNATIQALRSLPNSAPAELLDIIPFNSERKYSAISLRLPDGTSIHLVLGAFDVLKQLLPPVIEKALDEMFQRFHLAGGRSLLLLQLAGSSTSESTETNNNSSGPLELLRTRPARLPDRTEPLCILSLIDEIRDDAAAALDLFKREDIELKIMSGDSSDSVLKTLERAGLNSLNSKHISGPELELLADEELRQAAMQQQVFSRLQPQQKLDLVQKLQTSFRTAMIGDGVNDLPAIKEANLGIAMQSGSSITREIADIVLLNMRFETLPKIFEEGKRLINLVGGIAELYLTKNLMILALGIITLMFASEFPLTPRRAALISVIGVAMPVVFLTRFDQRTRSIRFFFRRLFSFLAASVTAFLAGGYFSLYLADMLPGLLQGQRQMIMLSVLIILSLLTYLQMSLHNNLRRWQPFVLSALAIFGVYLLLVSIEIDFFLFNVITTFYELERIPLKHWSLILQAAGFGAVILLGLHRLRNWWLAHMEERSVRQKV